MGSAFGVGKLVGSTFAVGELMGSTSAVGELVGSAFVVGELFVGSTFAVGIPPEDASILVPFVPVLTTLASENCVLPLDSNSGILSLGAEEKLG